MFAILRRGGQTEASGSQENWFEQVARSLFAQAPVCMRACRMCTLISHWRARLERERPARSLSSAAAATATGRAGGRARGRPQKCVTLLACSLAVASKSESLRSLFSALEWESFARLVARATRPRRRGREREARPLGARADQFRADVGEFDRISSLGWT